MRTSVSLISRERAFLLGVWGLGVVGCCLGIAFRPASNPGAAEQALDLVRILTTEALAIVLVLGPGLVLRARSSRFGVALGFLALPGLGLLAATGCAAWLLGLAGWVHPRVVSAVVFAPVLGLLLLGILTSPKDPILSTGERRALLIVAGALGVAIARSIWSLGPVGELFGGTIYRTLEVGDRPDSAIPYHVVQLIVQGASPYGSLAHSYFRPYTFSARGPLAGMASAPVVLLTGGRPSAGWPAGPWTPFDPDGYMSYRLAMMTFASTAFLSMWSLTRQLAGERAARLALLLASLTPFLVHEIWFTWPKLFAASLVLLAAASLIDRRPVLAGLLVGIGYLIHPLALLSVPALCLLALWPLKGGRLRRPKVGPALALLGGIAAFFIAWRLINGSHYTQAGFVDYLTETGRTRAFLTGHPSPFSLSAWFSDRLVSVGNTLVPLRLFFLSANNQSVNTAYQPCFPLCSGGSPGIVHFFFQYWTGVPFGLGIVFFVPLLESLSRSIRRWPWAITATVVVPFVAFAIYWGDASTGLLREGLHVWVFTVLIVVAIDQKWRGFVWLRHRAVQTLLALRAVEVMLVALLPTIVTRHRLISGQFALVDTLAVLAMIILPACLAIATLREPADSPSQTALSTTEWAATTVTA